MKRRTLLQAMIATAFAPAMAAQARTAPVIEVFKSANCGCCAEWVRHLEQNGFNVKAQNVANPSDYREKAGMPDELGSCHTALVQGYAIEGHVPARDIQRLLAMRPKAIGLAVPSMPMGSPGMEGPRNDAYDVFLVQQGGRRSVFHHYDAS